MPNVLSVSSSIASPAAGAENAGQPQPESYFASEAKSSAPQPAQRYVPSSKVWSYSPVNGRSVPFSRRTLYCSGVSSARHCSSVFWILVTLNSLPRAAGVTLSTAGEPAGPPAVLALPLADEPRVRQRLRVVLVAV